MSPELSAQRSAFARSPIALSVGARSIHPFDCLFHHPLQILATRVCGSASLNVSAKWCRYVHRMTSHLSKGPNLSLSMSHLADQGPLITFIHPSSAIDDNLIGFPAGQGRKPAPQTAIARYGEDNSALASPAG